MLGKSAWILVFIFVFYTASAQKTTLLDSVDIYISKEDYLRALPLTERLSDHYWAQQQHARYIALTQRKLAIHRNLNNHEKVLSVAFDALGRIEKRGDNESVVLLTKEIGQTYLELSNFNKAKSYFRRGHRKASRIGSDSLSLVMSQALLKLYFETEHDSTRFFLDEIVRLTPSNASDRSKYNMHNNLLSYHSFHEEVVLAKKYLDSTLYYARRTNDLHLMAKALSNAGALSIVNEDFSEAKRYYDEIFSFYKDTTSLFTADIYKNYSWVLYGLGRYKEAMNYFENATDIRDRIHIENSNRELVNLEKKYELEKLEHKFREQHQEQQRSAGRHQKMFIIVICLLGFLVILIYFYFQNNSLRQKNHLQELQSQQQQNLLIATLDGRETERKNIARVLHDNISALLSSAGLQLAAFNATRGEPSAEIQKARDILKSAHQQVRDLSHDLMPTMLAKFGLADAIRDLADKMSTPQQQVHPIFGRWTDTRYSEEFEMKVYFMVSELMNNAAKHAKATTITVALEQTNGHFRIDVSDDGKGIAILNEGFGLNHIRARVMSMGGTMDIVSPKKGTQILIALPLPV